MQYMFGRSADEIATALDYYDKHKQEIKMTFEKAVDNIDGIGVVGRTGCRVLVRQLEALGLLKFEEEKAEVTTFYNLQSAMTMEQLSKLLNKYGYKIVKA